MLKSEGGMDSGSEVRRGWVEDITAFLGLDGLW